MLNSSIGYSWLATSAADGYCGKTHDFDAGDCERGDRGQLDPFVMLPNGAHACSTDLDAIVERCLELCGRCARCRFISVSQQWRQCDWHSTCERRYTDVPGFLSGPGPTMHVAAADVEARRAQSSAGAILVKGERHSGTNFLFALLRVNFGVAVRPFRAYEYHVGCEAAAQPSGDTNCCSKHGFPSGACVFSPPVAVLVAIMRSPYSWLAAMRRECYCDKEDRVKYRKMSFDAFLRAPLKLAPAYSSASSRCHPTKGCENPVVAWSAVADSYANYASTVKILLRQSDLFSIEALSEKLIAPLQARGFVHANSVAELRLPLVNATACSSVVKNRKAALIFTNDKYEYHARAERSAREQASKLWSAERLEWVNSQLSLGAMRAFGFEWQRKGAV